MFIIRVLIVDQGLFQDFMYRIGISFLQPAHQEDSGLGPTLHRAGEMEGHRTQDAFLDHLTSK